MTAAGASGVLGGPAAAVVRDLGSQLGADQVLLPGPAYERALPLWNGAARAAGLPLSVRGAGDDWAGRALREGGLVVDLRRMRRVAVLGAVHYRRLLRRTPTSPDDVAALVRSVVTRPGWC